MRNELQDDIGRSTAEYSVHPIPARLDSPLTFLNDSMHFYAGYLATKKEHTSGRLTLANGLGQIEPLLSKLIICSSRAKKSMGTHGHSPHPDSLLNSTCRRLPWHIRRLLLPIRSSLSSCSEGLGMPRPTLASSHR